MKSSHIFGSAKIERCAYVFCAALLFAFGLNANADYVTSWPPATSNVACAPVYATVNPSAPSIKLNFPRPGAYQIFRKDPSASGSTCWGIALTTLPAGSTSWTDTSVTTGSLYEYKAVMTNGSNCPNVPNPETWMGASGPPIGYLLSGINVDETQPRGRIVLVVANDVPANLPNEYAQYIADLVADGWFVHVIPVAPGSYSVSGSNALATVTVTAGGTGYVSGTGGTADNSGYVFLTDASATGTSVAMGTLTVSSGTITSIAVKVGGGGFNVGDSLTLGNLMSGSGAALTVKTVTTSTANSVSNVVSLRNQIKAIYNAYPGQVKNVVLLGTVPVCFSGCGEVWDPDGHGVNLANYGADGYYANMTGTWTDTKSNYGYYGATVGSANLNLPGDGLFDQYYMADTGGEADMGFGRIDLSNGILGEYPALQFYLQKLHRYKIADPSFQPGRHVAIRPGFANVDETGWECAVGITGSLSGVDAVKSTPAVPSYLDADAAYTAQNGPYLFYFKGSGAPQISMGGKAVFWTGMQSHWGWWYASTNGAPSNCMALRDAEDSYTLSFTWDIFGLRYFYHRMGMGFDAGDMMRVSINNVDSINGTYAYVTDPNGMVATFIEPCSGGLFMNHFGDPALRLYMFPPPTGLSVVNTGGHPTLSWTASAPMNNPNEPSVTGYHVYRAPMASGTVTGPATRLTSTLVTGTTYTDTDPTAGAGTGQWSYLVRAVRLETTGCGTYYNASLGAAQSIDMTNGPTTLQIVTSGTLPAANWNNVYPATLAAQGGTPPYRWSVVSGTLPPGLALAATGTFAGLPTTTGAYSFKAQATDSLGQTKQQTFTITALPNSTISLIPQDSGVLFYSEPTRNQGAIENTQAGSALFRYNLAGLNLNNAFVSATLQIYMGAGCNANGNPNCSALLESALDADAPGSTWNCGAVTYNTQPAYNSAVGVAVATTIPVTDTYVDIDVTNEVRTALASNTSQTVSLTVFSAAQRQTVYFCTGYSFGAAIPQLIIQTTNAPKITITSPAVNPVYLYVNSGLRIIATVTAIPATAASLTTAWSKVSGPGTVTFSSPGQPSTNVTFSAPGDYVLQLSANDGVLQSSQTLAVTVLPTAVSTTTPAAGPANNLLMWLPLDETSGTIAHDVSGVSPANSGSLAYVSGSTNPVWSSTGGKIGGALMFSGSGQQVIVHDSSANPLDGWSQMSISFWMYLKANDASGGTYHALISKRQSSGKNESFSIALRNAYFLYCDFGHTTLQNLGIPVPGQWYHEVMVFDGTKSSNNLMLYTNGVADYFVTTYSSGTISQTTVPRNPLANLYIGAYDTSDGYGWNGLIDDVRIYNTALTIPQIQALYAAAPSDVGPVVTLQNTTVSGTVGVPFSLSATVTSTDSVFPALQWSTLGGPANAVFANAAAATTSATCWLSGSYTVQLAANDGKVTTFGDVSANISSIAGFAAWVTGNGLTGLNALDTATPAGDGISNLLKYALSLNPLTDGAEGIPIVGTVTVNGTNYLTLSYTQVLAATDITYTPEVSGDLQTWNSGAGYTTVVSTTPNSGGLTQTVVVRDLTPISSTAKRFIHLTVTGP